MICVLVLQLYLQYIGCFFVRYISTEREFKNQEETNQEWALDVGVVTTSERPYA